jgi:hypothetical protein
LVLRRASLLACETSIPVPLETDDLVRRCDRRTMDPLKKTRLPGIGAL